MTRFEDLPQEIADTVASFLRYPDVYAVCQVSRQLRHLFEPTYFKNISIRGTVPLRSFLEWVREPVVQDARCQSRACTVMIRQMHKREYIRHITLSTETQAEIQVATGNLCIMLEQYGFAEAATSIASRIRAANITLVLPPYQTYRPASPTPPQICYVNVTTLLIQLADNMHHTEAPYKTLFGQCLSKAYFPHLQMVDFYHRHRMLPPGSNPSFPDMKSYSMDWRHPDFGSIRYTLEATDVNVNTPRIVADVTLSDSETATISTGRWWIPFFMDTKGITLRRCFLSRDQFAAVLADCLGPNVQPVEHFRLLELTVFVFNSVSKDYDEFEIDEYVAHACRIARYVDYVSDIIPVTIFQRSFSYADRVYHTIESTRTCVHRMIAKSGFSLGKDRKKLEIANMDDVCSRLKTASESCRDSFDDSRNVWYVGDESAGTCYRVCGDKKEKVDLGRVLRQIYDGVATE